MNVHQKKETPRRDPKRGQSSKKSKQLTNKEIKDIKLLNKYVKYLGEDYG